LKQFENSSHDDLIKAYQEGLFTDDELLAAAGPELGALVEKSPEIALRMVDAFGGTELWIPVASSESCRLREQLSEADAQAIIDIYPKCRLKVPQLKSLTAALRRRRVAALRQKGWKLAELARYFHLSDRQIVNILKRHREITAP
jgi:hypothetical protein